jgi:hypothetical protein
MLQHQTAVILLFAQEGETNSVRSKRVCKRSIMDELIASFRALVSFADQQLTTQVISHEVFSLQPTYVFHFA